MRKKRAPDGGSANGSSPPVRCRSRSLRYGRRAPGPDLHEHIGGVRRSQCPARNPRRLPRFLRNPRSRPPAEPGGWEKSGSRDRCYLEPEPESAMTAARPHMIDFEASAFRRHPVEVGIAIYEPARPYLSVWSPLIRPNQAWVETLPWRELSQSIHGDIAGRSRRSRERRFLCQLHSDGVSAGIVNLQRNRLATAVALATSPLLTRPPRQVRRRPRSWRLGSGPSCPRSRRGFVRPRYAAR